MKIHSVAAAAALFATLALIPSAYAQQTVGSLRTGSAQGASSISGRPAGSGTSIDRLEAPPHYILGAIEFGEHLDVPCHIVARFYAQEVRYEQQGEASQARLAPSLTRDEHTVSATFSRCDGSVGDLRIVSIWSAGFPNRGVGRLAICQRAGNDRLKGITLYAALVSRSGVTHDPTFNVPRNRSRCNDPQPIVRCGSQRVATGLQITHGRATGLLGKSVNRRSVVGLGLLCSPAHLEAPTFGGN